MNKALLEARKKFRGQKATVKASGGFDNSPFPEGKYTCEIVKSEIVDRQDKDTGQDTPKLVQCLKITLGDHKGRMQWPFPPDMTTLDGITRAASLFRIILGDVVPGQTNSGGDFELDIDAFLPVCESLATDCIGKVVESNVKNSKKKRDDGTPWQNVYINRALGADEKGVDRSGGESADNLPYDPPAKNKRPTAKKKVAKKTVAPVKKKVAKRK